MPTKKLSTPGPGRPTGNPKRGRPIKKQPLADGPITPDDVRAAFAKAKRQPPSGEVERLASVFSFYKKSFLGADRDAAYTTVAQQAAEAAEALKAALAKMLAYQAAYSRSGDQFATWSATKLEKLSKTLESTQPSLEWVPVKPGHEIKDWRWLVGVITEVVAPSFSGAGNAKGGPVSRFLAHIIPLVSGDVVTASAIATQIQKSGDK